MFYLSARVVAGALAGVAAQHHLSGGGEGEVGSLTVLTNERRTTFA